MKLKLLKLLGKCFIKFVYVYDIRNSIVDKKILNSLIFKITFKRYYIRNSKPLWIELKIEELMYKDI